MARFRTVQKKTFFEPPQVEVASFQLRRSVTAVIYGEYYYTPTNAAENHAFLTSGMK
jgi:hypothetical protein